MDANDFDTEPTAIENFDYCRDREFCDARPSEAPYPCSGHRSYRSLYA